MQNDFISGSLGSLEAEGIVPNVCSLIRNEANKDSYLIFTQDTHMPYDYLDTQEGQFLPIEHCLMLSEGWNIHPAIQNFAKEVEDKYYKTKTIGKSTFGSFKLIDFLKELDFQHGLEEITLCGLCTDICVINNLALIKAAFPEVKVKVVECCCAGSTPEKHAAAIEVMKSLQAIIV